ncbi:hypothetical protein V501_02899 [Pseudogymnoascus sp. VKM F-4519 (FW-2642)]|nr:hypothetical protein V501_02899 [Pseudogymnoascus sp. VKM F-4519 (FW-2642)]
MNYETSVLMPLYGESSDEKTGWVAMTRNAEATDSKLTTTGKFHGGEKKEPTVTERHFDYAIHTDGHPTHSSPSLEIMWKLKFHIDTAGIVVNQSPAPTFAIAIASAFLTQLPLTASTDEMRSLVARWRWAMRMGEEGNDNGGGLMGMGLGALLALGIIAISAGDVWRKLVSFGY